VCNLLHKWGCEKFFPFHGSLELAASLILCSRLRLLFANLQQSTCTVVLRFTPLVVTPSFSTLHREPRLMDPSYDPRQQPGLEVVPRTHHSGLEVVSSYLPEVANKDHDTTKEVAAADYSSAPYSGHDAVPRLYSPPRPIELGDGRPQHGAGKWRFRWVIGAVIVAVVILAAVLGGVLGSRAARSSGESSASTAGESGDPGGSGNTGGPETSGAGGSSSSGFNSSDTAIKPPQLLRPGSGLSVTGWEDTRRNSGDIPLLPRPTRRGVVFAMRRRPTHTRQ
jgi:hypothetical protein